ncbi:type I pullulanase [Evansella sp. AB-P1]|uniref:type I pullulanase n=1 Tax=Evansella sp. AB-P1 TaxID=3037653 RepID=UPI00241C2133|nr:type I pullulanase [Evansella sp. AB-P1]MDG5787876.1 type I pullulanase [Evansella sp. AB-P1]
MDTQIAWIDDVYLLTVVSKNLDSLRERKDSPFIKWGNKSFSVTVESEVNDQTMLMSFKDELPMGEKLFLCWGEGKIPIYARGIVRTSWFDENYSTPNSLLGAIYEKEATTFTVWAPTATAVKLFLNNNQYSLIRQKRGVWQKKVLGDWNGSAYDYEVEVNGVRNRVNDPYAKTLLGNSKRGVVIDLGGTNPKNFQKQSRPSVEKLQDSIIYELHVRDATIFDGSGVKNKGKFLGLGERNTTTANGYTTVLSYIKELGYTHVQLLPINDFARVDEYNPERGYNWGYDPLFFQAPEGSYATDVENPVSRIIELKEMIMSLHEEEISIIVDVVYNHVYIMEDSSFEKIVPGYYFRYYADGTISNGTGVGNDIATERTMVRKFILDTIDYWLTEYKVDGFRFDLMGAIDVETMKQIKDRCRGEDIPIMLLGEGWDLPTAIPSETKATSFQSHQLQGIRFFNDFFRDTLKGNLFEQHDLGYVNGKGRYIERLPQLVSGSSIEEFGHTHVSAVNQTVNYVECHDNHTLWDRLAITNEEESISDREKIHQLATGITLLSQGVPFIHGGQEWFRSKKGDENSYISGDEINQLNWKQREENDNKISFIRTLIHIRKHYDVFRLCTKEEIKRRLHILITPAPIFGWTLFGDREDFAIYVNPTKRRFELHLPSPGNWHIAATNIDERVLIESEINGEYTFISPYELLVLKKVRRY